MEDHEETIHRHEEELSIRRERVESGVVRIRKDVETIPISAHVERAVESAEVTRAPANDPDSGEIETLADGSISIPVLEEELVIERRVRVRERIVVSKQTTIEQLPIETELRRERIDIQRR